MISTHIRTDCLVPLNKIKNTYQVIVGKYKLIDWLLFIFIILQSFSKNTKCFLYLKKIILEFSS